MRPISHQSKAFSLPELLLALGLVSILGVLTFAILRQFSTTTQIEVAKEKLLKSSEAVRIRLAKDLDAAIRADGSTRKFLMGIQNPDSPPDNQDPYDRLRILVEAFGEYSFPVSVSSLGSVSLLPAYFDLQANAQNYESYAEQVLSRLPYVMITNLRHTNLLARSDSQSAGFSVDVNQGFEFEDFNGQANTLSAVQEIIYFVDPNTKELKRQMGSQPAEVLAQNVERFVVSYVFRTRSGDNLDLILPTTSLRHIEDENYRDGICTDDAKCVDWSNIDVVQMDLSLTGDQFAISDLVDQVGSGFSVDGQGHLVLESAKTFYPSRFSLSSGGNQVIGEDISCLDPASGRPLLSARCNSSCQHIFTDSSPQSEKWEGYGRSLDSENPSNYCMCATSSNGDVSVPPAGVPWWPAWTDSAPVSAATKTRLDACLEYYGCTESWLQERHPLAHLSCKCLQPQSEYMSGQVGDFDFVQFNPDNIEDIPDNHKRCGSWRNCDTTTKNLMKFYDGGWSWPGGFSNWTSTCGCKAYNEDADGNIMLGEPTQPNYLRRCNKEFREGDEASPVCTNTWVGDAENGGYLLAGNDNPQGLTLAEASLCECMLSNSGRRANGGGITGMNGDWGGLASSYDFRAADSSINRPSPDLSDLSGYPVSYPGSTETNTVSFKTYDEATGSPTDQNDMKCDAAYCDDLGKSFGCCSAVNMTAAQAGVQAQYEAYAGYCSSKCWSDNANQMAERDRIRDIIRDPTKNKCQAASGGGSYTQQMP